MNIESINEIKVEVKLFKGNAHIIEGEVNRYLESHKTISALSDESRMFENCELEIKACHDGDVLVSMVFTTNAEDEDEDEDSGEE